MTEDQYNQIDWRKTHNNVAEKWVDSFNEQCKQVLKEFGITITFKEVDSPKYYNYSTDKCVCIAEFDPAALKKKLLTDIPKEIEVFETLITDRHKSRSGFISFYDHDVPTWLGKYINEMDNVIFETFLMFIIEGVFNEETAIFESIDNWFEMLEYESEPVS